MKIVNLNNSEEKELFDNKLTKSLASSNVNILLGSGFSMPLLSVLGSIEERLTTAKYNNNVEEIYNIEKEFFDSCILPLTNNKEIEKTRAIRNRFIHSLIDIISVRHSSVLHKILNIFTTNYDNLIEISLEDKHTDYFDGFTGKISSVFSTNNYGKIVSKQSAINNKTSELVSVNLIKLHGSLYWYPIEDKIVFNDFKSRISELESLKSNQTEFIAFYENEFLIVNPNEEKYNLTVLNSTYYDQIRLLNNELDKNNTFLLAFGFSFNDEHLKTIIDRALENPTLSLVIFAFDENSLLSLKKKFEHKNNVSILYAATVDDENNYTFEPLTLEIVGSYLEELYNAIK